jgi:lipopolysaccharide export system permease protein
MDPDLDEPPETFMKTGFHLSELKVDEAKRYVEQLRRAGFPYTGELAEYYKRYSFP